MPASGERFLRKGGLVCRRAQEEQDGSRKMEGFSSVMIEIQDIENVITNFKDYQEI